MGAVAAAWLLAPPPVYDASSTCWQPPLAQGLGTNLPADDYRQEGLLQLLCACTRDDLVYGLKHCAKRGFALEPG